MPRVTRAEVERKITTLAGLARQDVKLVRDNQLMTGYKVVVDDGLFKRSLFGNLPRPLSGLSIALDDAINAILALGLTNPAKPKNRRKGKAEPEIPDKCPCCDRDGLIVDEEYMQGTYGASYTLMPVEDWTFACTLCEEAGTLAEMREAAKRKAGASV